MNSAFREVGKSYPRHEAVDKAMGVTRYTDDLVFPGLAYGIVIRSPYSNAKVLSIDASQAETVEGVFGVLLPENVPQALYNCSGNPPSALIVPDEQILNRHPKCLGDRVCAVVAATKEACQDAVRHVHINYEILPSVMSVEEALKEGAPRVQPELSPDSNIMKTLVFKQGDIDKGLEEADYIFKDKFYTQPIQHVAMEPTGCICQYCLDGKITIWSPSQTPYQERRILAELFNLNENDIRIIKPPMGGGFGARQQLHSQHVGVLLSKLAGGRPVKLMNTREEDMYASATRHETVCTIELGVMKDGTITAARIRNYLNGGPYITHTPTISAAAGRKFQYKASCYYYEGHSIYTNSPTAGAMRGYGNIQVVMGREILMERAARELGLDPVEFRLKNHVGVGDQFPAAGYDITSCAIKECVRQAEHIRAEIDYQEPPRNDDSFSEGWGYAFCCHSSGPSNKDGLSSAIVMANDDGSVTLSIGSADIGQGSETVMSQIAAEELCISYELVHVTSVDTAYTPYDTGTFASGQTFVCGNAVTRACADLRKTLMSALAAYHGVSDGEIEYRDGCYIYSLANGEVLHYTFTEAVRQMAFGMRGMVLIGSASYKAQASPPPFAVCYAKASYNKKENAITIKDVIEIADVGTAINLASVHGQLEGGVAMGFGYAMMEDIEYDRRAGKTPVTNLLHYRVPLAIDLPRIHVGVAKMSYEPTGPLGAKSVGELAAIPIAPAILNAVAMVTGRNINKMPLSRDYILRSRLDQYQEVSPDHDPRV